MNGGSDPYKPYHFLKDCNINFLFRSVKYLSFEQKLPIRTAHRIFLESRHPEVTKNPYYLSCPRGAKKGIS